MGVWYWEFHPYSKSEEQPNTLAKFPCLETLEKLRNCSACSGLWLNTLLLEQSCIYVYGRSNPSVY